MSSTGWIEQRGGEGPTPLSYKEPEKPKVNTTELNQSYVKLLNTLNLNKELTLLGFDRLETNANDRALAQWKRWKVAALYFGVTHISFLLSILWLIHKGLK